MKIRIIKKSWPAQMFYDLRGRTGDAVKMSNGRYTVSLAPSSHGIANDRTPTKLYCVPADAFKEVPY